MIYKSLKIAVPEENYLILKRLGRAGFSFDDVITEVRTDPSRVTNLEDNSGQIKQKLKPTVVTICLTNIHEECTGTYVDTTNNFKIQCRCECHTNSNRKVRIRK